MDSSVFMENQTEFTVPINSGNNSNDQPVDFGPLVFKVLHDVSNRLGGVEYLIGEPETPPSKISTIQQNQV